MLRPWRLLGTVHSFLYKRIVPQFSTSLPHSLTPSLQVVSQEVLLKSCPRDLQRFNIEAQCPELIKLWHPTKNGSLKPCEISVRSSDRIWWKCTKGPDHEWFASPRSMYDMKNNKINPCPFCSNHKVSVTNSFATMYPELAAQWHPFLNGDVTPSKILPSSSFNAWWKCERGDNHVWRRMVSRRTHPRSSIEDKCPFCCGVDLHSQCLAVCRPDLAKEWNYEKNGDLTPEMVSKSSSKRVWWTCPNGHDYQCTVYNRGSTHNTGCPICYGMRVTKDTCLANYGNLVDFFDFQNNPSIVLCTLFM